MFKNIGKMFQLRGLFKGSPVKFNFSKIIDLRMVLDPVIEAGCPSVSFYGRSGAIRNILYLTGVSMAKGRYRVARPRKSMCLDRLS